MATNSSDFNMANEVEADLIERWKDLTGWINENTKDEWWSKIYQAYTEPHRKYHNLVHLHQMFQHYDQHKDNLKSGYACAFAIFFHDIVYDPKSQDNEKSSAALFQKFVNETTFDEGTYVEDLIKATASHCTDAHLHAESVGSDDVHYFLDFDMAILGSDPQDYKDYCKQIRQEYTNLEDSVFAAGRIKVLKLFLQIPNIYATQVFRESYEDRARKNIAEEIESLQKTI